MERERARSGPFACFDARILGIRGLCVRGFAGYVSIARSRTYRSSAVTFAGSTPAVVAADGIRVLPDQYTTDWAEERSASAFPDHRPAGALDRALQAVAERHGERSTDVVAMQVEYPRCGEVRRRIRTAKFRGQKRGRLSGDAPLVRPRDTNRRIHEKDP